MIWGNAAWEAVLLDSGLALLNKMNAEVRTSLSVGRNVDDQAAFMRHLAGHAAMVKGVGPTGGLGGLVEHVRERCNTYTNE